MATILPSNFVANTLSGTVSVVNGFANINLATLPYALEGDKPFVIKLRKGSIQGDVIATSPVITLKDASTVVSLTSNVSTLSEGNLVSFTLVTANAANGANVFYSVFPVTANVTVSDFFGGNTGLVTINDNQAVFALYANTDAGFVDETGEIFQLQLRTVSPVGNTVYTTSNITILDAYKIYNVLEFTESASTLVEGEGISFTFAGHNIPLGTTFYYSTEGNATNESFVSGNTGSFVLNSYSNTFTMNTTPTVFANQTRTFAIKVRAGSPTGTVYATSNIITVVDSALAYINASGGIVEDSGGYRLHIFTSSANLVVSSIGAGPTYNQIDYLAVAGGGGGGGSGVNKGGGGGGAGGLIDRAFTVASVDNITITVGAGAGVNGYGNNTIISSSYIGPIVAVGGGNGGIYNEPAPSGNRIGGNGGSGGGHGYPYTGAAGKGYDFPGPTQQGFPGGLASSSSGGGGGAGGAGQINPDFPAGTGGIGLGETWVPVAYGTPGPSPTSRYFSGGGGGGGASGQSNGLGGIGGGGRGAPISNNAFAGTVNTGGGGGGGKTAPSGANQAGGGGSGIVLIRYPYVAGPTFANVVATSNAFVEGSNITFTVNATGANTYTYYYTTVGNVVSSDFVTGNTGSFVANARGAVFTLSTNANIPTNETRSFALQIREDSVTGAVKATSANITIVDSALAYMQVTGGTTDTANGYRTHYFTTSGTFAVTGLGIPAFRGIEYFAVAGGGGGTYGGGGGAGGILSANVTLTTTGNYTIVVGGGGAGTNGTVGPSPGGLRGNDSNIILAGVLTVNARGGGGGLTSGGVQQINGGSGGGAFYTNGAGPAGTGIAGQGNPGGAGVEPLSHAGGGGGAGLAGAPGGPTNTTLTAAMGGNGIGRSWVTPSYGTPGVQGGGLPPTAVDTTGQRWFGGGGGGTNFTTNPYLNLGWGGIGGGGGTYNLGPGVNLRAISPAGRGGIAYTGGGGGSGYTPGGPTSIGTDGGSGIVIIRYPYV